MKLPVPHNIFKKTFVLFEGAFIFTFLCLVVLHLSLFMEQGMELELVMLACALFLDRGLFIITLRTRRPGEAGY